jgi:hypothetical protein
MLRDMATAFAVAAIGVLVLGAALERRGPWNSLRVAFVVLFLAVWGGGAWVLAIDPPLFGVYWVPFLLLAVLLATLLAVLSPPHLRTRRETRVKVQELLAGLGVFFWLMIASLVASLVVRYAS